MSARIIETNESPLQTVDVDGITVDLIENALKNAREEMDALVSRTALSPGIREQGDCFPMIANNDGKMVVGQFGSFIHGFTENYVKVKTPWNPELVNTLHQIKLNPLTTNTRISAKTIAPKIRRKCSNFNL